jgi:hypothetical protein
MSDLQPVSSFASQCMALVDAMNDESLSSHGRNEARERLSALIRQHLNPVTEKDWKVAASGER